MIFSGYLHFTYINGEGYTKGHICKFIKHTLKHSYNASNSWETHEQLSALARLFLVLYICVGFWLLAHLTRDLSQAEKKITVLTSWATDKNYSCMSLYKWQSLTNFYTFSKNSWNCSCTNEKKSDFRMAHVEIWFLSTSAKTISRIFLKGMEIFQWPCFF